MRERQKMKEKFMGAMLLGLLIGMGSVTMAQETGREAGISADDFGDLGGVALIGAQ